MMYVVSTLKKRLSKALQILTCNVCFLLGNRKNINGFVVKIINPIWSCVKVNKVLSFGESLSNRVSGVSITKLPY